MPQTPRRNSQTTTNWADQLSANRYAAGAAVAALLAAYVVAGRGETQRASIPPGATLITGLEALAPPRPKGAAPLGGKWPLDVLLVPGYERPSTCDCQLQLDERERCAADKCASVWKSKFYCVFVLNHRVVLHAIDATPARWRADAGSSPHAPDALVDFHTAHHPPQQRRA